LRISRFGRFVTYALPVLSVVMAALVLLGPGAPRPVHGVRVRGLVAEGSRVLALRLEGVRRIWSVDDALALDGVRVEAASGGVALSSWEGALGEDGVGEARLVAPEPLRGSVHVRVTHAGATLGEGTIAVRPAEPRAIDGGRVQGTSTGDALSIGVSVPRGQLAAAFPETIEVRVSSHDGAVVAGTAAAEVSGASIAPAQATLDEHGAARFVVRPHLHAAQLTVKARDVGGRETTWEGYLPVRPGAIWVAPAAGALTVRSQARRPWAYVSIEGAMGRVFGAALPLVQGADGISSGALSESELSTLAASAKLAGPPGPLYAIVAADPYEQGSGTSAWPLAPDEGRLAFSPIELVIDGVPAVEARETKRAGRARIIGVTVIALAALVEVLLLITRSRRSQHNLEAHLVEASTGMPALDRERLTVAGREHPVLYLATFTGLVLLAFALFAAVTTFH
jgi:hypothetical protein